MLVRNCVALLSNLQAIVLFVQMKVGNSVKLLFDLCCKKYKVMSWIDHLILLSCLENVMKEMNSFVVDCTGTCLVCCEANWQKFKNELLHFKHVVVCFVLFCFFFFNEIIKPLSYSRLLLSSSYARRKKFTLVRSSTCTFKTKTRA